MWKKEARGAAAGFCTLESFWWLFLLKKTIPWDNLGGEGFLRLGLVGAELPGKELEDAGFPSSELEGSGLLEELAGELEGAGLLAGKPEGDGLLAASLESAGLVAWSLESAGLPACMPEGD